MAADVTNEGTDVRQLSNLAVQARENLGVAKLDVVADKGYFNNHEVSACVDKNITPYVAKADTSANTARGLYGKSQFTYDAQKDVYRCPAGKELTYRFNTYELDRELRYYRTSDCKTCVLKRQCTRNKSNRTITREENEGLMEAMALRVRRTGEDAVEKAVSRTSFWNDQALVWLHLFSAEGTGESTVRVEPDDAGLQFQTGAQAGELGEVNGRSELKKGARSSLFKIVRFFDRRSLVVAISTNQHLSVCF